MNTVKQLVETIKEGIQEKKGQDIVIADLSEMDGTIAKYFIICQGGSPTQVEAIAESVGDMCRKNLGEKPVNVAGLATTSGWLWTLWMFSFTSSCQKYAPITTWSISGQTPSLPIFRISTNSQECRTWQQTLQMLQERH